MCFVLSHCWLQLRELADCWLLLRELAIVKEKGAKEMTILKAKAAVTRAEAAKEIAAIKAEAALLVAQLETGTKAEVERRILDYITSSSYKDLRDRQGEKPKDKMKDY